VTVEFGLKPTIRDYWTVKNET